MDSLLWCCALVRGVPGTGTQAANGSEPHTAPAGTALLLTVHFATFDAQLSAVRTGSAWGCSGPEA